jgi:hypothetical protein
MRRAIGYEEDLTEPGAERALRLHAGQTTRTARLAKPFRDKYTDRFYSSPSC